MGVEIRPCEDADALREYIDRNWRKGHILATDDAMFDFTYRTPWVDREYFPHGMSVLCLYDQTKLLGFLGATVAPYPRPQSYWGSLWHVHESLKGGGYGGKLLDAFQAIADEQDGWYGGFGAGPEALPIYLKRGYVVRAARRWVYQPSHNDNHVEQACDLGLAACGHIPTLLHSNELLPNEKWVDFRYRQHPSYQYDIRLGGIFRTEDNDWGTVTHVCMLGDASRGMLDEQYQRGFEQAKKGGRRYLMDVWSFDPPGAGWQRAPEDLPSVFHPPEARGNLIYAIGKPFLVSRIHKGDGDQDRPNAATTATAMPAYEVAYSTK